MVKRLAKMQFRELFAFLKNNSYLFFWKANKKNIYIFNDKPVNPYFLFWGIKTLSHCLFVSGRLWDSYGHIINEKFWSVVVTNVTTTLYFR